MVEADVYEDAVAFGDEGSDRVDLGRDVGLLDELAAVQRPPDSPNLAHHTELSRPSRQGPGRDPRPGIVAPSVVVGSRRADWDAVIP